MNKINTTEIGDNFEKISLEIIKRVIEEEQLGALKDHLRIYTKKKYYSSQRKKDIEFDIAIEVHPPNAKRFVMLYLIECKSYKTRVPVSKVQNFIYDIDQVSGKNVKGIFITNSPLMEGGYNIAESVGLMVIQGESVNNYEIILHKANRKRELESIPFINTTIDKSLIIDGVEHLEKLIDNKIIASFKPIRDKGKVSYGIDKLSKSQIENLANDELNLIDPDILKKAFPFDSQKLTEYLENSYNVKMIEIKDSDFYGTYNVNENAIGINRNIKGTKRELFILAHEFGHLLMHQKLTIGQDIYDSFEDAPYNFRSGKHDLKNPKNWIEWQANYFASSLVLPKVLFLAKVRMYQYDARMPQGKILLNDENEYILNFNKIVAKLSFNFNVTKISVIYKLIEMDLLNNQSSLKSIKQIVADTSEDLII